MEMDAPTRSIVDFVRSVEFNSLSPAIVHAVVRNYFDSVGCAAAGIDGDSTVIVRDLTSTTSGTPAASAYGLEQLPLLEFAILANAVATRYQDWDDTGLHGHPADMGPAIVATAEAYGASTKDIICGLFISYEIMKVLVDQAQLRDKGWDQGPYLSIGVTAALGKVLQLSDDQLANAISIAVTPSIPLRVTRVGQMSHWKGVASVYPTMTGVLAARLARSGMTGPVHVFDGIDGFFDKVTGPFDLGVIWPEGGRKSAAEEVHHKPYPALNNSMGPIDMMLELRKQFGPDDVESIKLSIFELGWHEGGGGQGDLAERQDPKTRESADHSLFYLLARALVDGWISPDSYTDERIKDPTLRPLMKRISIVEDKAFTEEYVAGKTVKSLLEVTLKDGRTLHSEVAYSHGQSKNPMTDDELGEKFDRSVQKVLPQSEHVELRQRLWNLPNEKDLGAITALYRKFKSTRTDSP